MNLNRPTSDNWFLAPIGRRPAWDRIGPPPPYNVPRSLLGQVPGTPAYPAPLLDAAAACACARVAGEAGAPAAADVQKISDIMARLVCLANGEVPANWGRDIATDVALAATSSPYCWIDPSTVAATMDSADSAAVIGDRLWAMAVRACPQVSARDPLAYAWDGVSSPPPRLVTLVSLLGVELGFPPLAMPVKFGAFVELSLNVARAAMPGSAADVVGAALADVIDELGGGSPLRIARAFLGRIGRTPKILPDPGAPIWCEVVPTGADTTSAMWTFDPADPRDYPDVTDPAREVVRAASGPPWGWILGGAGLVLVMGTAIYFGTRGAKKKRKNPRVVIVQKRAPRRRRNAFGASGLDSLIVLDAPLRGPMFTANRR
jgi:hypothetical protein